MLGLLSFGWRLKTELLVNQTSKPSKLIGPVPQIPMPCPMQILRASYAKCSVSVFLSPPGRGASSACSHERRPSAWWQAGKQKVCFFEVQVTKICAPAREIDLEVKICTTPARENDLEVQIVKTPGRVSGRFLRFQVLFAWEAQGFRGLGCRCLRSRLLNP